VAEAADQDAFFTAAGADLVPAPHARGPWAPDMMHGRLFGGLMARAIEREHAEEGLHVARFTVDLFRRAPVVPLRVITERVRDGGRIRVVDATVILADSGDSADSADSGGGGGGPVARASAVLLRRGERPPGEVWTTPGWDAPDPARLGPPRESTPFQLWQLTADGADGAQWASAGRRRAWIRESHELVAGESSSPFVRVALAADLSSPMSLFGTDGLRYINADYTLTLGRSPMSEVIGFESDGHLADDGVAVGRCTLHDVAGPIGFTVVTAVAHHRL
jgi:hypothetical protein